MVQQYLENIINKFKTGKTTEHSFRSDLQVFVENTVTGVQAINEPTRQQCGAPDYIVQRKNIPLGYIEAKDLDTSLDGIEKSEQIIRYKKSLDNLILTNYLEFRFYIYGEKVKTLKVAELENGKIKTYPQEFDELVHSIRNFCSFEGQTIKSSKQLATMMAQKAVMMKDVLKCAVLEKEDNSLKQQMKALKVVLLHDLDEKTFADIYAQTITYGLFVARLNDKTLETFSRQEARELVSRTNPFLRSFFDYISGAELDDRVVWIVDDLVEIFRACDLNKILRTYGHSTSQKDPFLHFYETFLNEYDKENREKRGVYYTPEPIVKFIVNAVDDILKEKFNLKQGLADNSKFTRKVKAEQTKKTIEQECYKVQILDPATGTGTFLAEVLNKIHEKFKNNQGMWSQYVDEALIPRLNGFEILMTPYVMCHLKLDLLLQETGYSPSTSKQNRFNVYLTNSLENNTNMQYPLFTSWLADEARSADLIKNESPIMVMIGNPPYSGESASGSTFNDELDPYKQEPSGGKLQERNSKWINDDYVKFIRLAQMFIDKNKTGVLAYINNHSFLDNPTFRGMRYSLLKSFDEIYIIDLHGNAKKKEKATDGSKDENVFNIQQGTSINLFVKTGLKGKNELAKVYHKDLYGKKQVKYDYLLNNNLSSVDFAELNPQAPYYFFAPKDFSDKKEYDKGFGVCELFKVNSVGIVTARDKFVIDENKEKLEFRIKSFFEYDKQEVYSKYGLKESTSFNIDDIKNSSGFDETFTKSISYRPFDTRFIYFDVDFIERSRGEIMKHFIKGDNLGLCLCKQYKASARYRHALITKNIIESSFVSNQTSEITSILPLYLYNDQQDFFSNNRTPNLNMGIVNSIAKTVKLKFMPEESDEKNTFAPIDVLDYIYGILHSNKYREKYKEFLKIDFPKIPYPNDKEQFLKLAHFGSEIRKLHLIESEKFDDIKVTYPETGSNEVEKTEYKDNKVYINTSQYFGNVPEEAWEFFIGGYQPAQKWLKDRKGRILSFDDLTHYQKIITALTNTHKLMQEIDEII